MRLFNKKKLTDIYQKYNSKKVTNGINIFDSIPDGKKKYKTQILELFEEAILNSDSEKLTFCIGASFRDGIDSDYINFFERVILEDWHEEHEDIVNIIYQFKDDRFSEALKEIALNESKYRKYDLELESTLRKCVHALKAIDSEKSNRILEELKATKNPNVKYALEMYNE
jgi:uncharacterized protein YjgD (DUF1641 family)